MQVGREEFFIFDFAMCNIWETKDTSMAMVTMEG